MLTFLQDALSRELERHPVALFCVLGLVAFAIWSYSTHARASDIEKLHSRIDTVATQYQVLEKSITRAGLESQIENIDREIFTLTREIEKADLRNEELPEIYQKRISELKIQRDKKSRELSRVDAAIALRKSAGNGISE